MQNLPFASSQRRNRVWWYVRPQLLASLVTLFLICVLVWTVTRTYPTDLRITGPLSTATRALVRAVQ